MLQRIQTVYFLVGLLFLMLTHFFSLVTITYPDGQSAAMQTWKFVSSDATQSPSSAGFPFVLILGILLFVVAIVSFKNRQLQMKVTRFNFLVLAIALVLLTVYLGNCADLKDGKIIFEPAFFFILPAMMFNWLAAKAIKKDDELIRSVDRIR